MSLVAQYLSMFRRRKWLIASVVAVFVLLALVITLLVTPYYTASSMLEIQRESKNFTMVEGVEPKESSVVDQEFYQTQYGLLKAKSLADRVAVELRLQDDAKFFAMLGDRRSQAWFEDGRVVRGKSTREVRIREAGDILLEHFSVEPQRLSRLAEISFSSPSASFSKSVVDKWASAFIQETLERRYNATAYARKFLEGRLGQLRSRIDESERQLVDYAAREGIVNLPASTPTLGEGSGVVGERSLAADDLAVLNRELARATADRVLAESRLGATAGAVSEALENQGIGQIRERRAALAAEYAKLMVQFEPSYPPAAALRSQIADIDRSIAREEGRVRSFLRESFASSQKREQELKTRVAALKTGVLDLRRRSIQYNIIQREVDTNRQLYEALLQRYKEIGVAGGVGVNNIAVVDDAETPQKPSSPNLPLNLIVALLVGGMMGLLAAMALEQVDEAITDPAEVENLIGIPLLGTIPRYLDGDVIEALNDRKTALSEAYISLQTSLAFSTDHGVPRTLAITSSRPAEGKTTTSFALAHALARSGRRIVLIDGDMRSPSLHALLQRENLDGLSNYLSGNDHWDHLVNRSSFDNLWIMTAGPQPPSAAELLSGHRFTDMLAQMTAKFDHVIIDAPPVMGLADAPLMGSMTEGLVFVIESKGTKRGIARTAIRRLAAANAAILGAIVTKFDARTASYGYGYDYGYGYRYGDAKANKSTGA